MKTIKINRKCFLCGEPVKKVVETDKQDLAKRTIVCDVCAYGQFEHFLTVGKSLTKRP